MRTPKLLLRLFIAAFFLNGVWEHAHLILYECAFKPYIEIAAMMWQAIFADALIAVLIYLICVHLFKGRLWSWIVVGALVAFGLEWYSVMITHRWAYNAWMPTLFGIGITPLLQMMVLPALASSFARLRREP